MLLTEAALVQAAGHRLANAVQRMVRGFLPLELLLAIALDEMEQLRIGMVLLDVLDRGPVEVRPYALVHFPSVFTAENCILTVSRLLGEVKSPRSVSIPSTGLSWQHKIRPQATSETNGPL